MRNVWKFGTRWSDRGIAGTSIFKEVFYPNGLVFATTNRCLDICEGDLFAVADGYAVVAIAEALTPGCNVTKLRKENYGDSVREYLEDSGIYGCRARYFLLSEDDSFPYKKMGKFFRAGDDVTRRVNDLFEKYKGNIKTDNGLPRLFDWANKELAQDSFLCWILQCASSTYEERQSSVERQFGFAFLKALLAKHGISMQDHEALETLVIKQSHSIDVACRVVYGTNRYGILIEDKVSADVYNNIEVYRKRLANDVQFKECEILPTIVRTGDEKEVFKKQYPFFLRKDFLDLFKQNPLFEQSQILSDFHAHMQLVENRVSAWQHLPIGKWEWDAWKGFFSALQRRGNVKQNRWTTVPRPGKESFLCAFPAWDESVRLGPFYLYWQVESDNRNLVLKVLEVYSHCAVVRDAFIDAIDAFIETDSKWKGLGIHKPTRKGTGCSMSLKIIDAKNWYGAVDQVQTIEQVESKISRANDLISEFLCVMKDDSRTDYPSLRSLVAQFSKKK